MGVDQNIGVGGNQAVTVGGAFAHSLHRPSEVHRSGTNGTYAAAECRHLVEELFAGARATRSKGGDEPHRASDADRRRPAHGKRGDRIADVLDSLEGPSREGTREEPLVDDVNARSVR